MSDQMFAILGIAPTKDEAAIREAYLAELPKYHPEEDPEGFLQLREAYESALGAARQDLSSEVEDDSDSGRLAAEMQVLLDDFKRRLDVAAWKEILDRETCARIDVQDELSVKLLILLMQDYYLPQRIWQIFDTFFRWSERSRDLKKIFPARFIDYVLHSVKAEELFRASLFDPEDAADDYFAALNAFYALSSALTEDDLPAAKAAIDEAPKSALKHPDFIMLAVQYHYTAEEPDQGETLARELALKRPDDLRVMQLIGQIELRSEQPEKALACFESVLEKAPDQHNSKLGKARALYDLGRYEESKAQSLSMLIEFRYDGSTTNVFHLACEKLIGIYEKTLVDTPDDQEIIYKLASCYFNEGDFDRCLELIQPLTPEKPYMAKHYELLFDLLVELDTEIEEKRYDELVGYLERWEAIETDRKRLQYLPEKYIVLGSLEIALEKAAFYLQEFPNDSHLLGTQAQLYRKLDQIPEAFDAAERGLSISDSDPIILGELALLHEITGDMGDAISYAEQALYIFPIQDELWQLLMRIHWSMEEYDKLKLTCEHALSHGMDHIGADLYLAAIDLNSGPEDKIEEAIAKLEDAIEHSSFSFFALRILGDYHIDARNYEKVAPIYSRLLETEDHPYYYVSRGWARSRLNQVEGAIADYRKAIEIDPDYFYAHYCLGEILMFADAFEEAIAAQKEVLRLNPTYKPVYFQLVKTYGEMGEPEKAHELFLEALEQFKIPEGDGESADAQCDDKSAESGGDSDQKSDEDEGDPEAEEMRLFHAGLYAHMIGAFHSNSRYEDALDLAEKALALDEQSTDIELQQRIAYCYYEIGDDATALRLFKQALEKAPDSDLLLDRYGHFLIYGKHDYAGAVEIMKKAFAIAPCAYYRQRLAIALQRAGDQRAAHKHYKLAIKEFKAELEEPGCRKPCAHFHIGECYYGLGKFNDAERHLQTATEGAGALVACVTRYCYEATFILARIYKEKGMLDQARAYYEDTMQHTNDREYREMAQEFE